jgi:hypothetical protein
LDTLALSANSYLILYSCRDLDNWENYCSDADNTQMPCTAMALQGAAMSKSQPSLPIDRAFVVQFRAQPTGASSAYDGRVEHVVSGQVARFHSLEELLAFMTRVLTEVQSQSDPP